MKKVLSLVSCLFLALTLTAQRDTTGSANARSTSFPPVSLLLPDGKNYYTQKDLPADKAVLVMLFNPSCTHCQQETEEITRNINKFSNIHILMCTPMPLDSMLAFRKKYNLAKYSNIVVTQDSRVQMPSYYMISNLPFLAFYNRKRQLIGTHEGSISLEKLLAKFKN